MVIEEKPVYVGEADDTNEFGVRIQVGALDQHVQPATAREFAAEIIAAADRAEENDREERAAERERILRSGGAGL